MTRRLSAVLLTFLTFAPSALAAQAPAPPPAPRRADFTADLGLVSTSGNSNITTYNVGEKIVFRPGHWTLTQNFGIIYGKTGGVVNANSIASGLRGDYNLAIRLAIYGLGKFERNTFAGVSSRFEEATGLSAKLLDTATDQFSFEFGLGYIQQRAVAGDRRDFLSARTAGVYRHNFSKAAFAQQSVEVLPNLKQGDDYRINSETSLSAPLSSHLALKSALVIKFDNLPEPGFKSTDRTFTSGLQITF
jgi:putative salt-induced outer membrane protein YdiY